MMQGTASSEVQGKAVQGFQDNWAATPGTAQAGWAVTQDRAQTGWAVAREAAQAGWEVARERTREAAFAGWEAARERTYAGCVAAKERVDTLREGKSLLDHGGSAAERAIRAKAAAREAAARDASVAESVAEAVAVLEDAVAKLRAGRRPLGGLPDDVGGLQDFDALAEAYEARAATYKQLLNGLFVLPPAPRMSVAEEDAMRIMQFKDGFQRATQATLEGCEAVRERRSRST